MPKITIEVTEEQLEALQASGEPVEHVLNRMLYRKAQRAEQRREREAVVEAIKARANANRIP